jgi:hypothetical protein
MNHFCVVAAAFDYADSVKKLEQAGAKIETPEVAGAPESHDPDGHLVQVIARGGMRAKYPNPLQVVDVSHERCGTVRPRESLTPRRAGLRCSAESVESSIQSQSAKAPRIEGLIALGMPCDCRESIDKSIKA